MSGIVIAIARPAAQVVVAAGLLVYAGLVVAGYAAEGPHFQLKFDAHAPLRSVERLAVGAGVRLIGLVKRGAQPALDLLYDASADVGEWYLHRKR